MNLTFIDTETTGIQEQDVIIQLGFINEIDSKIVHEVNSFFNNGTVKISLISKATHGIMENDIKDFPIFSPQVPEYKLLEQIKDDTIFVGHNVQFDIGMLTKVGLQINKFIDTLQITKHLLQDQEEEFENTYRLDVLKFYFMEKGITFPNLKAHDAMSDVLVMKQIFKYFFSLIKEKFSLSSDSEIITKMIELTNSPILLKKINFGKYKGTTFAEIAKNDRNYLEWLGKNSDDENVRFTCGRYLRG
ncbi:3'-5' exonuclease [Candidatus Gracilibacteria bacterium]|nr:3'-5' exonuclease [Candidatus Gracilibacteria bacterium]